MKKYTLKLTSLALALLVASVPQTAVASSDYEAAAVHYEYDLNADPPADPGRIPRFQLGADGIYVNPDAEETNQATLMITGDLMCQWRQQEAAFTSDGSDFVDIDQIRQLKVKEQKRIDEYTAFILEEHPSPFETAFTMPIPHYPVIPQPEGTWNFDESFQYVREILQGGDLVIGNLETMLSHSSPLTMQCYTLEGRPYLNSPVEFLDGLDYAGFDLLTLANNHSCDTGVRGLLETLQNIDRYGFLRTGAFADKSEQRCLIANVNGIKVGIVSYASYYNTKDANFTAEGQKVLLNRYSTSKARRDIRAARKAGAEYVIAFMHWGTENTHEPTYLQKRNAANAARAGADYIVGSHPHAIQPFELIDTPDGRQVPVIYSMGNFLSCMQLDVNNDSLILQLDLNRDADGEVVLASHNLYPCTIMHDLEITDPASGSLFAKVRTDRYVVTPHDETFGPGAALAGRSYASRQDLKYMAQSLDRYNTVFEGRTQLPLPYSTVE